MKFELNYEVDLSQPVLTQALKQPLFYSDSAAHELIITLKDGAFPSGVSGYVYFVHMNTSTTERQVLDFNEGNYVCSVEFPAVVYNTLGPISIVVQLVDGEEKTTILALAGEVRPSKSDTVVDCSGIVLPDVDDLIAQIDQIQQEIGSSQDFITNAANSVRYNETQSLTASQKLIARGNIDASSFSQDSCEWLYTNIFGNNDNWTAKYSGTTLITKSGRLFTMTGTGTNNSTYYAIGLTGTSHTPTSQPGSGGQAALLTRLKNNYSHDINNDFVPIPGIFRRILGLDSTGNAKSIVELKTYITLTKWPTTAANRSCTFYVLFRRMNANTGEYDYSDTWYNSGSPIANIAYITLNNPYIWCNYLCRTKNLDNWETLGEKYEEYDEMAIYWYYRSNSLAGTMLVEPFVYWGLKESVE